MGEGRSWQVLLGIGAGLLVAASQLKEGLNVLDAHDASWGFNCRGDACGQSPSYFACDCQTFNGCAGDWNTPNCP